MTEHMLFLGSTLLTNTHLKKPNESPYHQNGVENRSLLGGSSHFYTEKGQKFPVQSGIRRVDPKYNWDCNLLSLVGGPGENPSEKYDFVNWDDYSQYISIYGKIKNGNQTTNQKWDEPPSIAQSMLNSAIVNTSFHPILSFDHQKNLPNNCGQKSVGDFHKWGYW